MHDGMLSAAVLALIAHHIDSVQQVEILRLLRGDPRAWAANEAAAALRIAPATCVAWLDLLTRATLVERTPDGYRGVARPDVDELLAHFELRRARVVSAIHGPS